MNTIAVDVMGGDHGLTVTVPACLQFLSENQDVHLILVGRQEYIQASIADCSASLVDRMTIQHASEEVDMDESPSSAMRKKKDSSMRVALNLVKDGSAAACVSAGNTGALMATARYVLKMLPGVDRPALFTRCPSPQGKLETRMLDLGANVDSQPEHLVQFATMGAIIVTAVSGKSNPTVGLLNIGEEEIKGNETIKQTAQLLSDTPELNYVGFVEGNDCFGGKVDVVVCDGLLGNVSIKTAEGVFSLILSELKEAFQFSFISRLQWLVARTAIKRLFSKIDPRKFNGASFVGLQGVVIKSHGSADEVSFKTALDEALLEVRKDIPTLLAHHYNKQRTVE